MKRCCRRRSLASSAWLVALAITATAVLRRRGYHLGRSTVVRCRQGHLFMTIWIPLASIKSLRLGWWRLQYCPVGRHWSLVAPVKETDLSEEELLVAQKHRDIRLP